MNSKNTVIAALTAIGLLLSAAGCSNMTREQQRALSGGAIGAGAGIAVGLVAGANPWVTGALGAASGAVIGAVTK